MLRIIGVFVIFIYAAKCQEFKLPSPDCSPQLCKSDADCPSTHKTCRYPVWYLGPNYGNINLCQNCPPKQTEAICNYECDPNDKSCNPWGSACKSDDDCKAGKSGSCSGMRTFQPPCDTFCKAPEAPQCGVPSPTYPNDIKIENGKFVGFNPAGKRMIGGLKAKPHSFPWMAVHDVGGGYCGGAVLNKNWIITAAHCFDGECKDKSEVDKAINNPDVLKTKNVMFGANTWGGFSGLTSDFQRVICKPVKVVMHPEFCTEGMGKVNNDIALVKVDCDIPYTDSIRPICLPPVTDQWQTKNDKELLLVAGWGREGEGKPMTSVLNEQLVTNIPKDECAKLTTSQLSDAHMCGQKDGFGVCQGDSGSPVVAMQDGKFTLTGIVSFGSACSDQTKPDVYAYVPRKSTMDFIQKTIAT